MTHSTCELCGTRIVQTACGTTLSLTGEPHVCNEVAILKHLATRDANARSRHVPSLSRALY